VRMEV